MDEVKRKILKPHKRGSVPPHIIKAAVKKVREAREMNEVKLKTLKEESLEALRVAEVRAYKYAVACDIGDERVKAFEIFENVRVAGKVY